MLECTPTSVVLVVGGLCVGTSAIPTQVIICAHHALVATVQNWVHAATEAGGGGGKGAANTVRTSSTVSLLVMVVRDTTPILPIAADAMVRGGPRPSTPRVGAWPSWHWLWTPARAGVGALAGWHWRRDTSAGWWCWHFGRNS